MLTCSPFFHKQEFYSSHFSHSVESDSLRPHGLQHTRLPCPSPTPRANSNSCPSHQWCHPTILSSVVPFSPCLQSFPAIRVFFQWVSSLHQVAKVFGEGNGKPLQCPCLENSRGGGAWWAAVYGVTQSWTQLKWLSSSSSQSIGVSASASVLPMHQF